MKKVILLLFAVTILCGCVNSKVNMNYVEYPTSSYITKEMREKYGEGERFVCFSTIPSISEWAKKADAIVLATIISIDNIQTILPNGEKVQNGYTVGEMLIQDTLKGKKLDNNVIPYAKTGGLMSMRQYQEAAANTDGEDKAISDLQQNVSKAEYINTMIRDVDYLLEEGKTYFMMLKYSKELKKYEMIGCGWANKETDVNVMDPVVKKSFYHNSIQLFNIMTRKYEALPDVVKQFE